jgi:Domain of unknown function (DUF4276)
MRPLRALLVAEGASDRWFLPKVLERALDELCRDSALSVLAAEVEPLENVRTVDSPAAITAEVKQRLNDFVIAFLHYDGTADPDRERCKRWDPLMAQCPRLPGGREWVPVVPIREMEAWAVADREALLNVTGVAVTATGAFQVDLLSNVQRLEDPKRTLGEITARGRGTRRRKREAADYFPLLAERISLDALRNVESFRQWECDTVQALRKLGFLR